MSAIAFMSCQEETPRDCFSFLCRGLSLETGGPYVCGTNDSRRNQANCETGNHRFSVRDRASRSRTSKHEWTEYSDPAFKCSNLVYLSP